MAKKLMKTAKELAWKAYHDAYENTLYKTINEIEIKERFENWWSENYGNRSVINFYHDHNVYIDGSEYIKAY